MPGPEAGGGVTPAHVLHPLDLVGTEEPELVGRPTAGAINVEDGRVATDAGAAAEPLVAEPLNGLQRIELAEGRELGLDDTGARRALVRAWPTAPILQPSVA